MSLDRIASGALHIATIITCMLISAPAYLCRMQLPTPTHVAVNFMHATEICADGDCQDDFSHAGSFVNRYSADRVWSPSSPLRATQLYHTNYPISKIIIICK